MDLARLLTPRAPELEAIACAIHAQRPDLRAAFPDVCGAGFRQWLGVNGIFEFARELARFYPPVPPAHLMETASCGLDPLMHLRSGADDFRIVAEFYEIFADRPIEQLASVLDFGCGCGRLLRWFQTALPACKLVGSDVRAASIEWCCGNLRGTFLANKTQPPLDLPDASVDLVVALSVFSHLNLRSNLAWIRELARVCKPDGLMLLSTHGAFALALTARSREHQEILQVPAETAREYLRRLQQERFVFHPVSPEIVRRLDGVEDEYGQVFFDAAFVKERWSSWVEVLGCVPAALVLLQDFYALRPRRGE